MGSAALPEHLSFEMNCLPWFEVVVSSLGYNAFKLVPQAANRAELDDGTPARRPLYSAGQFGPAVIGLAATGLGGGGGGGWLTAAETLVAIGERCARQCLCLAFPPPFAAFRCHSLPFTAISLPSHCPFHCHQVRGAQHDGDPGQLPARRPELPGLHGP